MQFYSQGLASHQESKWPPDSLPETKIKTKVNNPIQKAECRGDQLQGAHHEIGKGNMPWEKRFPKWPADYRSFVKICLITKFPTKLSKVFGFFSKTSKSEPRDRQSTLGSPLLPTCANNLKKNNKENYQCFCILCLCFVCLCVCVFYVVASLWYVVYLFF